jgi:hypothetical protein
MPCLWGVFLPFRASENRPLLGWRAVTSMLLNAYQTFREIWMESTGDSRVIGWGSAAEVYLAFRWISRLASFSISFFLPGLSVDDISPH